MTITHKYSNDFNVLKLGNYTVVLSTYEEKVSTKYFFTVRGSSDSFRLAEVNLIAFKYK